MKKISIVIGSEKKDKCDELCNTLVNNLKLNYELNVYNLRDYDIPRCLNCEECHIHKDGFCHKFASDIDNVIEKLVESDFNIIITPIKFFNVNGLTKLFMDRTYPSYHLAKFMNKKFAFVFVGYSFGLDQINKFTTQSIYGFILEHSIDYMGSFSYKISKNTDWQTAENEPFTWNSAIERDDTTINLLHTIITSLQD